jgi:DNA-binding transcriptional ArsR family regulator
MEATRLRRQRHGPADETLARALAHTLRHRILIVLYEREGSPTELAEMLEADFQAVARHVRWLRDHGLIELVDTDQRRGGIQHFYRTVVPPVLDTAESAEISELIRSVLSAQVLRLMLDDLRRASEAGTFDGHEARSALRKHYTLDDQGIVESGEACMEHLSRLDEIQSRSVERMTRAGEEGRRVATATLAYPVPLNG